jgi:hypothetical protein
MALRPDVALATFTPTELRELALDLGVEPEMQQRILREAGEFAESEFLASLICSILDDLENRCVPVADYVRAVALVRSVPRSENSTATDAGAV